MRVRPQQLGPALKTGLAPVYVVAGDEPLICQECGDAIVAAARERGFTERQVATVEVGFDWRTWRMGTATGSLFAERRVFELRLAGCKPGDAGAKALGEYAARPADDALLLLTCGRLDAAAQKSRWLEALDRTGVVVQVWPVAAAQLPDWIGRRMAERGLRPTADALAWLAGRLEGNLLAAAQAVDLLRMVLGPGTVDLDSAREAVGDSARYSVYDLADAALAGKPARVARILMVLRAEGVEPALVSWSLHREVALLATLAHRVARGDRPSAAIAAARVWERRKPVVSGALQRLGPGGPRRLLRACGRTDRAIKGIEKGDPWQGLTALALALAGAAVPGLENATWNPSRS